MPNKPTTLREEFKKQFEGYWRGEAISDEICFWWLDKLTSHNTELLRKIEGMKKEVKDIFEVKTQIDLWQVAENNRNIGFNKALDQVISIINQEK